MKNFVYPAFCNGLLNGTYDFVKDRFKIILATPSLTDDLIKTEKFNNYNYFLEYDNAPSVAEESKLECIGCEDVARGKQYIKGGKSISFVMDSKEGNSVLKLSSEQHKDNNLSLGAINNSVRWAIIYRDQKSIKDDEHPNGILKNDEEKKFIMCFEISGEADGIRVSGASIDLNFNDFMVVIKNNEQ